MADAMEAEPIQTNPEPISCHWAYRLAKRAFLPGSQFFEEGDIQCNILIKQLKIGEEIEELIGSVEFRCDAPGCAEWFSTIASYEAHYNSVHRNRCHSCQRSFPSMHLLDIHILENHDTLFQMIATKRHMYRCLVESCPDRFSSEEDRKEHLVTLHKYPADFRFNRKSRRQAKNKSQVAACVMAATHDEQGLEHMEVCPSVTQVQVSGASKVPRQRLPRTVCFGRGSARSFQRDHTRMGKGKKKNKDKTQTNHSVHEVAMNEVS